MLKRVTALFIISTILLAPAVTAQNEGLIPNELPEVSWREFLPRAEQIESFVDVVRKGAERGLTYAATELENASYEDLYRYVKEISTAVLNITERGDFAEMLGNPDSLEMFNALLKQLPDFVSVCFLAPGSDFEVVFPYINSCLQFIPYAPDIAIALMTSLSDLPEIIASIPVYMEALRYPVVDFIPVCIGSCVPICSVWIPKLFCIELPGMLDSGTMLSFVLGCFNTFGIEPLIILRTCLFSALPDYGLSFLEASIQLLVELPRVVIGTVVALILNLPILMIDLISLAIEGIIGVVLSSAFSLCIGGFNFAGLWLALGISVIAMIRSISTLAFITEPMLGIVQPLISLGLQLLSPRAIANFIEVILELF
jgi:hypothetical protein